MKKLSRLLSGAALAMLITAPSMAVESPTMLQAVLKIKEDIEKILATAGTPDFKAQDTAVRAYLAGLNQQPALNQAQVKSPNIIPAINMPDYASTLTQQQIKNILTTIDDTDHNICNKGECLNARDVSATFTESKITKVYRDLAEAKKVNPDDQMLNIDTLLGPLTYTLPTNDNPGISQGSSSQPTSEQQDPKLYARHFIQIVAGLSDPIRLLTPVQYEKLDADNQNQYISRLQAFSALVSVGMNNLYQMYVERLPLADRQPSLAETEAQMVARRMTPEWRNMIESASPVTIARENLYLQAEINYQLYRSRLQQERILATLSVLQLQNLQVMVKTGVAPPMNKPPVTPGTTGLKNQSSANPPAPGSWYGGGG